MARSGTVLRNMMVVGLMHSQSELSPASLPLSGLRRTDTIILSSLASAAISSPAAPMAGAGAPRPPLHPPEPRAEQRQIKASPFRLYQSHRHPSLRDQAALALPVPKATLPRGRGENGKFRTRAVGARGRKRRASGRWTGAHGGRSGERPPQQQGQIA